MSTRYPRSLSSPSPTLIFFSSSDYNCNCTMTPMVHRLILFLSMMMKYQCDAFFSIPSRSGFKRSEISSNAKYTTLLSAAQSTDDGDPTEFPSASAGKLEELKQEERRLASMLATVRLQKLAVLKARPLHFYKKNP